jgi:pyrroloquinoline quinone biosynthesis protein D
MTDLPPAPRQRLIVGGETRPVLPRWVRLHHDAGRARWVLLAPERIIEPNEIAVEVLQLCDGIRNVTKISGELAGIYDAPQADIQTDVVSLLQELADNGYIRDNGRGRSA